MQLCAGGVHSRPGNIPFLVFEVYFPDFEFGPLQFCLDKGLLGLDVLEKLSVLGELRTHLDVHVLLNTGL